MSDDFRAQTGRAEFAGTAPAVLIYVADLSLMAKATGPWLPTRQTCQSSGRVAHVYDGRFYFLTGRSSSWRWPSQAQGRGTAS